VQIKQQIEQLLDGMGVRPSKRHGQNFLIDLNLMRYLVDAAALTPEDIVLEVGPGTGSMTQEIVSRGCKVLAVEIDKAFAEIARRELAGCTNVEIANVDVLSTKNTVAPEVARFVRTARRKHRGRFVLLSNLPYNTGTPLMMNLIVREPRVDAMYVTVQKEVAQRMTALPGEAAYGTLSIIMAAAGNARMLKTLKPSCFWPQPDVDSAMVEWVRDREKAAKIKDIRILSDVVALFLQHRRKMLRAATKFAQDALDTVKDWDAVFKTAGIVPESRPDDLSPADFVRLANAAAENTG
jgi:16S rRNA (adenine1518-N6/adenine1519-N6)-dimethyltransferase